MLKLIIDNKEIEVPKGTKVIDAAEKLGIMIPRFCYHPALGSAGACRVCAVKVLEGPVKGLQMSCMIEAKDGMVISTTDEEAADFRKHVIELLMLNHPHDCPVCDEGGQCLLQDMTISGGHGIRRYKGKKRTHTDQYLGPLVQHEMNRCIQCYRCSRYYREYTGYNDLGVMGIGSRVYFGRQKPGILESPFSGNLVELCPTGVYTDKPSRFKGRRWDFNRTPSICINCSLGCNTVVCSRYREIVRQEARYNENINGYFICDRGRYGFFYAINKKRPRDARINGQNTSVQNAVKQAGEKLDAIAGKKGRTSIACIGSYRNTLETQAVLKLLAGEKGWRQPVFSTDPEMDKKLKTAVSRLNPEISASLKDIEKADFILVIGADPVNEAPMLALSMRQAQRAGAEIAVIDPRPVFLPFEFKHLAVKPDNMESCLGVLIKETVDQEIAESLGKDFLKLYNSIVCNSYENNKEIFLLAKKLQKSQHPVIICGTDIVPVSIPDIAADTAFFLKALNRKSGLFYIMPGPSAMSAGLLSDQDFDFENLVSEIENGNISALIAAENDFFPNINPARLKTVLEKLELLIIIDYLDTKTAQAAHIFIPAQTIYESGGIFINQQGWIQQAEKAYTGGLSIEQTGRGDHPPREFRNDIPGTDSISTWKALAEIGQISFDENRLAQIHPAFSSIDKNLLEQGTSINFENTDTGFKHQWQNQQAYDNSYMELIIVQQTFGTEILSSYSPCLQELESAPYFMINKTNAHELNLEQNDFLEIDIDDNINIKLPVKIFENMAQDIIILPGYRKILHETAGINKKMILKTKIRKRVS